MPFSACFPPLQHRFIPYTTLFRSTAVRPPGRFGALQVDKDRVTAFVEKPPGDGGWINGGFMAMSPKIIDLIEGDATALEVDTLARLDRKSTRLNSSHLGISYAVFRLLPATAT